MLARRSAVRALVQLLLTCVLVAPAARAGAIAGAPFALLELFTSEGWSSCPPADRMLSTIAAEARAHGQRVITLELHVDYWDTPGWTDPFSNREYSKRQRQYAQAMGLDQMYTPQLVVNGTAQCVGSDRKAADAAIGAALARTRAAAMVELHVTQTPGGYRVNYLVSGAPKGSALILALVDPREVEKIAGGENEGRTLTHTNVVRQLVAVPLGAAQSGTARLASPRGAGAKPMRVIGVVQDAKTLAVLGAAGE